MKSILDRFRSMPKGVKASIAFFSASVIANGISYIVTPIYTRLLTTAEYGKTNVFLTWVQVFGIIAMFCLSYGVFNNGMVDYPDKRDEFSFSLLILSNIITLVFSSCILAIYPFIRQYIGLDFPFILLMCVLFFFQPAYNFWTARQRYEFKYKTTVFWSVLCAFLSPCVAIISMSLFDNKLYARIFGAETVLILIYIGFYFYLGIKSGFKVKTEYWKAAIMFNLPLIPHYLSTYLLANSDKLMISYLVNDSATAFYSVAYTVAAVATIVWNAANASLVPYTYENCKNKNYNAISRVTMPLLFLFAIVCVIVILMAPEVVSIMATEEYRESIYVIPPIVGGVFFQVQYYIYANIVYYYKKTRYIMYASVASVILNLVLNYIFIRIYGYVAAAYTTLVCYIVQAVIDYFAMKKAVKEKVYNMRIITILSCAVIAISLLSISLYDFFIIRYILFAFIALCLFVFRKQIISTIRLESR